MTDRRLIPANAHVAAVELRGKVDAPRFVEGRWHRITRPVADLLRFPGGPRDRQLLFGQRVRVLERRDGFAFLQSARDGYVGYVAETSVGVDSHATHRVAVTATHLYTAPGVKVKEVCWLSHGSELTVRGPAGRFLETDDGLFVPASHLAPLEQPARDPVAVARLYLGTPYLWGGNSRMGIDCSGLVQATLTACGLPCPGDSDLQHRALGSTLPEGTPAAPGDLLFWKGHVAMAVDARTMIHANAFHMATVLEPIDEALPRIAADPTTGPLLAHKRLARISAAEP